ncbi:DinB family protein [Lacibacter sediminis]|uniref:DinB family protein n=1 Tax=Lacibacter sediminis TaxID=2760713 RepID=A0A7G5XD41_9BACT|nr:DinB family protein [Lacibacter sediminis]QNA43394.1 DinB family protein [Lacibacter sediminis]
MKQINSNTLLELLQSDVREILLQCTALQNTNQALLTQQPQPGKWSVAQVLEHLNIYARYYITAIEERLHLNQSGPNQNFTPGWLGNYFTNLMKPTGDKHIKSKMKSPANAVPSAQPDAVAMLTEFINHQHHLLNLLQIARTANLDYNRVPISLTKLIKLKLGDTFRFFIAHEQRHFLQIENTLKQVEQNRLSVLSAA